jgi:CubicO group peptidase (beta-lactamase class C family)
MNLFEPQGITDMSWETDSSGIALGGWEISLTPRDMAKLGDLYLHGDRLFQPDGSRPSPHSTSERITAWGTAYSG